jgi:hypothetical protein
MRMGKISYVNKKTLKNQAKMLFPYSSLLIVVYMYLTTKHCLRSKCAPSADLTGVDVVSIKQSG